MKTRVSILERERENNSGQAANLSFSPSCIFYSGLFSFYFFFKAVFWMLHYSLTKQSGKILLRVNCEGSAMLYVGVEIYCNGYLWWWCSMLYLESAVYMHHACHIRKFFWFFSFGNAVALYFIYFMLSWKCFLEYFESVQTFLPPVNI